ncbi:MAG: ECF transporter S component [Oscillospiraceae bacterium]|nr:ECF transporter S component [Oscillospiraceae bacterium]
MANTKKLNREQIVKLAMGGILTAVVVVLQLLGSFIKFGPFSVSLVLVPIIVGAALCGPYISTWLGFVFGVTVLLSGDAALFLAINIPGTVITVLLKGALCGLTAGLVFAVCKKLNTYLSVVLSAIVCPITNTGIFLVGCRLFFYDTISDWGADAGFTNTFTYMIVALVGLNFVFELASNIILCPAIVRIVNAFKK